MYKDDLKDKLVETCKSLIEDIEKFNDFQKHIDRIKSIIELLAKTKN